ncbi:MAG TPA: NlpC/P60 family protein [Gemmataceae bacterium]|nr:NlpC/P60 family protein [Gemmataceae bacterium]
MTLPPGWQADIIKALGGTHTAGAEHLLGAWQQWEGGGTANAAHFNPLNTTIGSNYPKINSVGVSAFPDWKTGIAETVNTLKSYPAVVAALRTGKVDFTNPALQADFNRWLSGKRTPGMTDYVRKIASSYGQNLPPNATKVIPDSLADVPVPAPVTAKTAAPISLMDIALGKRSIMDMFFQKRPSPFAQITKQAVDPLSGVTPEAVGGWTSMPTKSQWTPVTVPLPGTGTSVPARTGTQLPATSATPPGVPASKGAASIIATARQALGTPYVWGGATAGHFDCSGLVQFALAKIGVSVPHGSIAQSKMGQAVPASQLRPGDAVFFEVGQHEAGYGPGHVGIYIGSNQVIEAPHTGANVRISTLFGKDSMDARLGFSGARRFA